MGLSSSLCRHARRSRRWLARLPAIGLVAIAACSPTPPTGPGYYVVKPGTASSLRVEDFMAAAGCTAVNHGGAGRFAFIGSNGHSVNFDCHGQSNDVARRALKQYRAAFRNSLPATLESNGGDGYYELTFQYSTYACSGWQYTGTTVQYTSSAIIFTDYYVPDGCTMTDTYSARWVPGCCCADEVQNCERRASEWLQCTELDRSSHGYGDLCLCECPAGATSRCSASGEGGYSCPVTG
jgi:hypothetical protein